MAERKPQFIGNSVLPDVILGLPLNPAKQGLGPSGSMLKSLWDHDDIWKYFSPQYVVDVKDTALLHLAGLVKPDVKGERLFGYGQPKRWSDVIPLLEKMYPEHRFPGRTGFVDDSIATMTLTPS